MFNKKLEQSLKCIDEAFNEFKLETKRSFEYMERKNNQLRAEIFKIKNPNGNVIMKSPSYIFSFYNYKNVLYQYATQDEIKEINFANLTNLDAYKIFIHNNTVYIGLKSGEDEEYFVIDIQKELAIKIENSKLEEMDKIDWIAK